MGDGRTTNINIGGGNIGGLQIGDNNHQKITQTNGDQVPTVPQVFGEIRKSLGTTLAEAVDQSQVTTEEQADDFEEQVVMPLQTLAELPEAEQKKPDTMEQATSLLNRLVPYAPGLGKGLAVFGSAALASLAGSNPIISGILAVCKLASAENPGNSSSPG
jgi:hypothetical protein